MTERFYFQLYITPIILIFYTNFSNQVYVFVRVKIKALNLVLWCY